MKNDEMNASEAVYGFAAWLSSREEREVFSCKHDSARVSYLVKKFCETNELPPVSKIWPKNLMFPIDPCSTVNYQEAIKHGSNVNITDGSESDGPDSTED